MSFFHSDAWVVPPHRQQITRATVARFKTIEEPLTPVENPWREKPGPLEIDHFMRKVFDDDTLVTRLALDISLDKAFFIETSDGRVPGVKAHLTCLPSRYRREVVTEIPHDLAEYVRQRNEYFARYLEGRLNTCD